jgi:hypothetical protein
VSGSRAPVHVPKGVLVSAKKKVTSSDMQPVIGELDMLNDGEKAGGDGYFIELGPGPQWVQIDLGAPHALHAILAWHYHSQARVYRDVIVLVSNDATFKTGVVTVCQQRPRQHAKLGSGRTRSTSRSPRAALRPEGRPGAFVSTERQHHERSDPLRRSRGLRLAEMTRRARALRCGSSAGLRCASPGPRCGPCTRRSQSGHKFCC